MIQLVLSSLVGVLAWLQVVPAIHESSFEFEQRVNSYFKTDQHDDPMEFVHDTAPAVSVQVFNMRFKEARNAGYVFRRAFWPWQPLSGVAIFDVRIQGLGSEEVEAVADELGAHISISPCSHADHSEHHYLQIEPVASERPSDRIGEYEWILYDFVNQPTVTGS